MERAREGSAPPRAKFDRMDQRGGGYDPPRPSLPHASTLGWMQEGVGVLCTPKPAQPSPGAARPMPCTPGSPSSASSTRDALGGTREGGLHCPGVSEPCARPSPSWQEPALPPKKLLLLAGGCAPAGPSCPRTGGRGLQLFPPAHPPAQRAAGTARAPQDSSQHPQSLAPPSHPNPGRDRVGWAPEGSPNCSPHPAKAAPTGHGPAPAPSPLAGARHPAQLRRQNYHTCSGGHRPREGSGTHGE